MKIRKFGFAVILLASLTIVFAAATSNAVTKCTAYVKNPFFPPSAAYQDAKSRTIPFIQRNLSHKGYTIIDSEQEANLVVYDTSLTGRAHLVILDQSTGIQTESNEWCDTPCWFRSVALRRALKKVPECK